MVTRQEKERRAKSEANKKFRITSFILLIPSVIAILALYQTYGLPDKLHNIEQQMHQLEEYKSRHVLEMKIFEKRLDSIQTARTDTSGK